MIRVGFLVECGPEGLEVRVLSKICELIANESGTTIKPVFLPMDDKNELIEHCGASTSLLIKKGCDRVVIVWDERPSWPDLEKDLCWFSGRARILENLSKDSIPLEKVGLVAIEREFESWLLFDEVMLTAALKRPNHKYKVEKQRHPDKLANPKGQMIRLFKRAGRGRYNDVQHSKLFAEHLTGLTRLRKCETFVRFENKVLGV